MAIKFKDLVSDYILPPLVDSTSSNLKPEETVGLYTYTGGIGTMYQDNMSTILLAKNGRGSSGKRTCHINIRFFFIEVRIDQGEVEVESCPTGETNGRCFFTKALQGTLLRKFRDTVLTIQPGDGSASMVEPSKEQIRRSVLKDRHAIN